MKKHLFYSVLFIFVVTSVVTLAGIAGFLTIPDKNMEKLEWAFLGQLAAAVITLFRKTDFFGEEQDRRIVRVESAIADTAPRRIDAEPGNLRQTPLEIIEPVRELGMNAAEYFQKLRTIEARPLERDTWLASIDRHYVTWEARLRNVSHTSGSNHLQVALSVDSSSMTMFFFHSPLQFRDLVYSFQIGDMIRVRGRLSVSSMAFAPSIEGDHIERLTNA